MKKILYLTLKEQWFDMIASGEKKEEYREIKPYWQSRLCSGFPTIHSAKKYDIIEFKLGYRKNAKTIHVKWKGMKVKYGKSEWGAKPGTYYYAIKLGEIIK